MSCDGEIEENKEKKNIYCAVIVTAYPDYKRPSSSTTVEFFSKKEDAEKYIKDEKRIHYNDYNVKDEDSEGNVYDDLQIEKNEDPSDYDDKAFDRIYSQFYMGQPPFDGYVINVSEKLDKKLEV